ADAGLRAAARDKAGRRQAKSAEENHNSCNLASPTPKSDTSTRVSNSSFPGGGNWHDAQRNTRNFTPTQLRIVRLLRALRQKVIGSGDARLARRLGLGRSDKSLAAGVNLVDLHFTFLHPQAIVQVERLPLIQLILEVAAESAIVALAEAG